MIRRVIDSHLHLWPSDPTAWTSPPPEPLQSNVTLDSYLALVDQNDAIQHALVVQPSLSIDHTYVENAIQNSKGIIKGMMLANPKLGKDKSVQELERLHENGFCAVRFNPQNFENLKDGMLSDVGQALYMRAGELKMAVGFMCFKGLDLYFDEITGLIKRYPKTIVIIDHFGFFRQPALGHCDSVINETTITKLMTLKQYPQVHVKLSALFRLSGEKFPHYDLQSITQDLLQQFGSDKLMWGSDFPFVLLGGHEKCSKAIPYGEAPKVFDLWLEKFKKEDPEFCQMLEKSLEDILYNTAHRVFRFT